jgi:formate dehydrogenase major subunit
MMFPNYQRVTHQGAHAWFEKFWDSPLDDQPGYTVVEIMHKALAPDSDPHKVRGMYIMGENPAMSDPDLNHARHALASLEHLVVQDIFMTETAWLADVVLPATPGPRRPAPSATPTAWCSWANRPLTRRVEARADLWIIQQLGQRLGAHGATKTIATTRGHAGEHHGVALVYEEMRQAMHTDRWHQLGAPAARVQRDLPLFGASDPGEPTVFIDNFPTPDGRVRLVPATSFPPTNGRTLTTRSC